MSEFVLQDSRSNTGDRLMFWAKDGAGYTTNLDAAQRYTREKATSQNESRESDLPWPLEYLMDRHTLAVDCQNVNQDEVVARLDGAEQVYLYVEGAWNGNDLVWLTLDGMHSSNLADAQVYDGCVAGPGGGGAPNGLIAIPKTMADGLSRKVVATSNVKHKESLRGTGIMLAKPTKYRAQRDRCDHCGVFISEDQRFQDCPKCGGSNAP
ncbi:hypothetical protein WG29040_23310 [Pseudomonas sp. PAMC 29040]|uniref:hypothetical protein n=1 Tax=Pseudomonas sp. PAMC 29040 TaxID=2498450 RepID=UPI000FAAD148|nr:hypothetical protein [Pseudomonas sp. PAMC 29040]RUT30870.1 hypothetical protein WG29040_23310 [Pseudomonas sp. PAMC 29040]